MKTTLSKLAFTLVAILSMVSLSNAAIILPAGGFTSTFDTQPGATEWSTLNITGAGTDVTNDAAMDLAINGGAGITAVSIGAQLAPSTVTTATTVAQWNNGVPANPFIQSAPTGNKAIAIMATLQNGTGSAVSNLAVSYDLGLKPNVATGTVVEEIAGHRVYYSLTGSGTDWVPLGDKGYNGDATTVPVSPQSQSLSITPAANWASGSNLFLLFVDDNGSGSPDSAYTLDNVHFTPTVVAAGGTDPISVTATPASGTGRVAGQTVQVTNAAAGANPRDAAAISGVGVTGSGFSQAGLANGSLAAGASQTSTVAFSSAGLLNGPATGTLNFSVASGANGAGTGSGSYSYPLSATVSGNSGAQASTIANGGSLAGLSGKSDKADASTATFLGGTVTGGSAITASMAWRTRTAGETPPTGTSPPLPSFANGLTSDVLQLTGTDNQLFALQMTYNPAELQQPDVNDQAVGHLFLASLNTANGQWVNAVSLNHTGVTPNTTNPLFLNFHGSYASFLAANGGALTSAMLGAWGVDTADTAGGNVVWAVLNHNSEFASVPEPSSIVLGAFGLVGLVLGVIRRRRNG